MGFDFSAANVTFLGTLGASYTLTRSEDLLDSTPATETFTGIGRELVEDESVAPGAGSNTFALWVDLADWDDPPDVADEVTTETTVYKIVDKRVDGAGGLDLKCRYDRAK
jgi:hypothetical protein